MAEYTATFEIESASDARTVSRLLDDVHDRLREEDRRVGGGETAADRMLAEFGDLKSRVDADATGRLVVTYETGGDR